MRCKPSQLLVVMKLVKSNILSIQYVLLLFILSPLLAVSQPRTVNVSSSFIIDEGDYSKSYLVLENVTTGEKQTIPGQAKFSINLKFNCQYIMSYTKPDYVTKKIEINTNAPADRIEQGFEKIEMKVFLFKQYEGMNIVVYNQPVAKYTFSKMLDDYDYDTDYTKQVQAALKESEHELAEKKAEEKQKSASNAKAAEIAKQDSIAKAKLDLKAKAEEDKRLKEETKAKLEQEAKAKADSSALAKKEAAVKAEEDKRKLAKEKAEEDDRKKAQAKMDADERAKAAKALAEEDARKKAEAKADEEEKRKLAASSSSGTDQKKTVQHMEGSDVHIKQQAQPTIGSEAHELEKSDEMPATVNVEEITEANRIITKAVVTKSSKETIYFKIVYKWGGVYFFQGEMPITQNTFQLETKLK